MVKNVKTNREKAIDILEKAWGDLYALDKLDGNIQQARCTVLRAIYAVQGETQE